jgi:hypothetical protein
MHRGTEGQRVEKTNAHLPGESELSYKQLSGSEE